MALELGFHAVPAGHLATVVTDLEMTSPPARRATVALPDGVSLARVPHPDVVWYRELFSRVGGQDWLWVSRLKMPQSDLAAILADENVEVYVLRQGDLAVALLELDFRESGACEIAFFGVAPALTGSTAGRFLMSHAIDTAFAHDGMTRLHLHTCTMDHPRALAFYRRSGFTPWRQRVEVLPDPRLTGDLPPDAGPHMPVFA
jgi:hypothetical protein